MKAREHRQLYTAIQRIVPDLVVHKEMAIVEPRNRILRGVAIENSSSSDQCYVWMFVQPLFEPPPFQLAFGLGERLRHGSALWRVSDADELAHKVATEGVTFWSPASTPEGLASWSFLDGSVYEYAMRAKALALIACRAWRPAVEELTRALGLLAGGQGWRADMAQKLDALKTFVERDPEGAHAQLAQWEAENVRTLGLDKVR